MYDIILLLKNNVVGYNVSIYVVNNVIILPFCTFFIHILSFSIYPGMFS
jgi:hypothetical protein